DVRQLSVDDDTEQLLHQGAHAARAEECPPFLASRRLVELRGSSDGPGGGSGGSSLLFVLQRAGVAALALLGTALVARGLGARSSVLTSSLGTSASPGRASHRAAVAFRQAKYSRDYASWQEDNVNEESSYSPRCESVTEESDRVCWHAMIWLLEEGIRSRPDLYAGLDRHSSQVELQAAMHRTHPGRCPKPPCLEAQPEQAEQEDAYSSEGATWSDGAIDVVVPKTTGLPTTTGPITTTMTATTLPPPPLPANDGGRCTSVTKGAPPF
ncbi:unnamed protein product, partial [Polarella glacialis]